ncbi:MAG: hypothetical protein LH471_11190 [Salinibacterium sp.]|nr:hypothetical protein [Salinibacterium sp.]
MTRLVDGRLGSGGLPADALAGGSAFTRLPRRGRIALLVIVALVFVADVVLFLSGLGPTGRTVVIGRGMTTALAQFALLPPTASISRLL